MITGFFAALLFALLFAALLSLGFRRRGPGPYNGLLFFFLLILAFSWAGGTWIFPFGPVFWDVSWLSFLVTAFFIMLLIALLVPDTKAPPSKEDKSEMANQETKAESALAISFGLFFWIVIILLVLAALAGTFK